MVKKQSMSIFPTQEKKFDNYRYISHVIYISDILNFLVDRMKVSRYSKVSLFHYNTRDVLNFLNHKKGLSHETTTASEFFLSKFLIAFFFQGNIIMSMKKGAEVAYEL